MARQSSRRGLAVTNAINAILGIIQKRDEHELIRELAKEIDPEVVAEIEARGDIPRWYMDLVIALIKLYDQGYADSTKDSEQLK